MDSVSNLNEGIQAYTSQLHVISVLAEVHD